MQLHPATGNAMELPGEPMIYSIKYPVGKRQRGLQFFRNMKWYSFLKTFFRTFNLSKTPVVLIIRFMVSPTDRIKITAAELRKENVPAVMAYELCDYTLSFLEMLHHVLFNSYRQVVKLDVEKFYSSNPRTIVQYMKWDEYVILQNNNTLHTKTKSFGSHDERQVVQPKQPRNGKRDEACAEEAGRQADAFTPGTDPSNSAFCSASTLEHTRSKKKSSKLPTTYKEA